MRTDRNLHDIENNERTSLGAFESVPNETLLHVYSFLNRRELQNMACLNSSFASFTQDAISYRKHQSRDNIFYAVGRPIPITEKSNTSKTPWSLFLPWVSQPSSILLFRETVSKEEIMNSFREADYPRVKLFLTEEDAQKYAVFFKTVREDGQRYYDFNYNCAIFKVQYIDPLSRLAFKEEQIFNSNHRTVQCVEVDRISVVPIEVGLQITLDNVINYPCQDKQEKSVLEYVQSFFF
jgi:hypothetical protein